jgi:hypothetical protein
LDVLTPVYFPPLQAENVIRGAAGLLLPRVCADASAMLQPRWAGAPSGYATPPKPFAIRAYPLDGRRLVAGERFSFEIVQFALGLPVGEAFAGMCALLETEGLGPGRGKARLARLEATDREFSLEAGDAVAGVVIDWMSPTDADTGPGFLARLHDRINALRCCYGGEPPLAPLSRAAVTVVRDGTRVVDRQRTSTRTGQSYGTGGRVGPVEYAGELTAAMPFLRLGEQTGLGGGWYRIGKVINW